MIISTLLVQFALAVILILIVRWIGTHSLSLGYEQLSIFVKGDESPAFNFVFRVLSPIVYIILLSTTLYSLKLDCIVKNIYLINVFYVISTLFLIILFDKVHLINWYKQIIYWGSILFLSYQVYIAIIAPKKNILIDLSTFTNEIWIVIIVFLYQIINQIDFPNNGEEKRKKNYLTRKYQTFKNKYGEIISRKLTNQRLEMLFYAIMIYESFNRPKAARIIEYINFKRTKRPHTLGLMQVRSDKMINDLESVNLALDKILNDYKELVQHHIIDVINSNNNTRRKFFKRRGKMFKSSYYEFNQSLIYIHERENDIQKEIIRRYNGGAIYRQEVEDLLDLINEMFYNNSKVLLVDN